MNLQREGQTALLRKEGSFRMGVRSLYWRREPSSNFGEANRRNVSPRPAALLHYVQISNALALP